MHLINTELNDKPLKTSLTWRFSFCDILFVSTRVNVGVVLEPG